MKTLCIAGRLKAAVIRAFIAIKIPEDLKGMLLDVVGDIEPFLTDLRIRWVRPETMHLTLKFLGDISVDQQTSVEEVLRGVCLGQSPFTIAIGTLGCFPNPKKPRVVWMGIEDPGGELQGLHRKVDEALQGVGFEGEKRRFNPHLTLGRVKSITRGWSGGKLISATEKIGLQPVGSFQVKAVTFFRSDLESSGAVHTALGEYLFGGAS